MRDHDERDLEGAEADDHGRRHARKERVLHTRISEDLADDIRRLADDLRVPVSNLVRNVLEEAFSVVESVSENVGELIEDVVEEAERARGLMRRRHHRRARRRFHGERPHGGDEGERERPGPAQRQAFPDVVGWQPLILNRPHACADCEEVQEPGDRVFAGLGEGGLSGVYLCRDCMQARSRARGPDSRS
jgi:hypothetical protein